MIVGGVMKATEAEKSRRYVKNNENSQIRYSSIS
jgi:hypothetical protein